MATGTFILSQQNVQKSALFLALIVHYNTIHRKKNDGDWYIYILSQQNVQKSSKTFKRNTQNVFNTGTNIPKIWLTLYFMHMGIVTFAYFCGKMYSTIIFSYEGSFFSRA